NFTRGPGDPEKHRAEDLLEAAIDRLDQMGIIDPDRVGVTGLSFGGEIVIYALFHMQHLAAAIASGTEYGPASTFINGIAGQEHMSAWGLGSPQSDRWRDLSLTLNANRVRTPLLLNVADHEMVSSLAPAAALRNAARPVEMRVFPDEFH